MIRKLAEEESCVFIGRCADFVLEGTENLVRVHLNADLESRMARIAERNPQETDVLRLIRKVDRERNDYYRYYTGRDWANSEHYDLVINTTKPGIEGTVAIIRRYLETVGYEP